MLASAGVLAPSRPLRFADPGMRAAIYASLPPGTRAVAHRRAVRVLGEAGAGPMTLAGHACAVEPAGDPFVADALVAAGRRSLATGQTRVAALLLERALAEPPPRERTASVRLQHGRALALLGDARAPALIAEALPAAMPRERERLRGELVDALWLSGAADEALASPAGNGRSAEPAGLVAAARHGRVPAAPRRSPGWRFEESPGPPRVSAASRSPL